MKLMMTVLPTLTAVTLDEAKSYSRVATNDDDALIQTLVDSAVDYAEGRTNRQLCVASYEAIYSYDEIVNFVDFLGWRTAIYGAIRLPKAPLKSIDSIQYQNIDGTWSDLDSTMDRLKWDYDVGIIEFTSALPDSASVKIDYTCGYESVPASIKSWIFAKVNTAYEYREHFVLGKVTILDNATIDQALDRFKVQYL